MRTRVYFVRHGEAEGNVFRRFHGQFNSALTENGLKQLEKLAERLKDVHFDAIYSSDLDRTMDTARAVAKGRGLEIKLDSALREIDGGKWEDRPWEELPEAFPDSYNDWLLYPDKLQMPGGESMVEFQGRLLGAVSKILEKERGKTICIVSHGTAIKALLCDYTGCRLSAFPKLKWHDNASITIVDFGGETPKIILEGDNAHLGHLSTMAKQDWWR